MIGGLEDLQICWQGGSWLAALIPYSASPPTREEKSSVREAVQAIAGLALSARPGSAHVFLQTWKIATEGAASLYEENISRWLPSIGMGVWPLRNPPRRLSQADAMDCAAAMLSGEEPAHSTNFLSYVSAGDQPATHALQAAAGSGLLLAVFSQEAFDLVAARTKQVFLPAIQDAAFRKCRFYMPLLDRSSLVAATPVLLETWMCGGHTYLRESAEDGGLLVVSRSPVVVAWLEDHATTVSRAALSSGA